MPLSTRDYSDSDSDGDGAEDVEMLETPRIAIKKPPSAGPSNPLKVTLRPGLSHLAQTESTKPHPASSDRSSLSPPPPITLKLGMKAKIERAYSSDEETYPVITKKAKPGSNHRKKVHPPPLSPEESNALLAQQNTLLAQHRKSYDWLQPSAASASHQGPPERGAGGGPIITGWNPDSVDIPEPPSGAKKKSHKKKPEGAPVGPGKSWRKGLKKGMGIPWKEGQPFVINQNGTSASITPGWATPASGEGTPEPADAPEIALGNNLRGASPPFVLADPVALGFPVFSKPIAAPIFQLTTFPKVTAFFGEHDSTRPFRKEKVRSWKDSERTLVGIGGGQLKFKTWTRGPSSELGRILAAEREAREVIPRPSKARLGPSPATALQVNPIESLTGGTAMERPPLVTQLSDSIIEGEDASETSEDVTPTKPKPKRAKPRKSKLGQELIPEAEAELEAESEAEAELEPEPRSEAAVETAI